MIEDLTPRIAVAVGLLALVPVIVYAVGRSGMGGTIAAVNVILIVAALYVATRPVGKMGHASANELVA